MDMLEVITGVMESAERNIGKNVGDYEKDGILYCGKCNTPKQIELDLFGQTIKPYCLCECEIQKRESEENERKQREWKEHIQRLKVNGFPDAEMTGWRFEKDDHTNEKVSTVCRRYAERFSDMHGKGLLLFGSVGTGKTFMAACIANYLTDKGIPCLVTSFARLANRINKTFDSRQEVIDELNEFELLVIDDLAAERDTEYMSEIVHTVIDARYRSGLPLIITTNLTAEELKHPTDVRKQRLYSRLFEMCIPVEVAGADRRQKKLKDDYDEYAEILGLKGE